MVKRVHQPYLNRESMPWAREVDRSIARIDRLLDASRQAALATNRSAASTGRRLQQVVDASPGDSGSTTRVSEIGMPIEGGTTTECDFMTSGILLDATSNALITGARFLIDSPPTGSAYRAEFWRVEGLTLVERLGMNEGLSAVSTLSGTQTWMEISGSWGHGEQVAWAVQAGNRYAVLIVRLGGTANDVYMTSAPEPEPVAGLGLVQMHAHVGLEPAVGVDLIINPNYQTRVNLLTAIVPPHSHDIGDIKGLAFEAHFSYQGDLAVYEGAQRLYNASDRTRTITAVSAAVGTAPAGSAAIVDVNLDGTTIFTTQANRPTIADGANYGSGVPTVQAWLPGSYLTVDIDQIGSTVPGSDLTVVVMYS